MSGTGRNRSLFLLEYFHRVPLFVGRGLFIFERALEIHLGQRIIRIKFQETREQDFRLREITIAEFANSFLIRFQPDQLFLIERSGPRIHDGEDIDRFGRSFDLGTRDGTQMKFVADQIRRRRTDKNVHSINARQPLQTRRQINRIADHRKIGAILRTDVSGKNLAMINANAHSQSHAAFRFPAVV